MKRNIYLFFMFLATICILLIGSIAFGKVAAASSSNIVSEEYNINVSASIPENWKKWELDGRLIISPPSVSVNSPEADILIVNYDNVDFHGGTIIQKELYNNSQNYNDWVNNIVQHEKDIGQSIKEIDRILVDGEEIPIFQIINEEITTIGAYRISQGQPFAIALKTTGSLSEIKSLGYYDLFLDVIMNTNPANENAEPFIIASTDNKPETTILEVSGDNQITATKSFRETFGDVTLDRTITYTIGPLGPPSDYNISSAYNKMYYSKYNIATIQWMLANTSLNYDPSCTQTPKQISYKTIGKKTTKTVSTVTDTWSMTRKVGNTVYNPTFATDSLLYGVFRPFY